MLNTNVRWLLAGLSSTVVVTAGFFAGCTDTQITSVDAGVVPDSSVIDTGLADVTTTTDGGVDAKPDVVVDDSGLPPLTLENYVVLLGITYASRAAKCCEKFDAGVFDQQKLIAATSSNGGFDRVGRGISKSQPAQVTFDTTKAKECLAKIEVMPCSYSAQDLVAIRQVCLDAVTGKGAAGSACTDSIQCAPGNYCTAGVNADAGAGTCAALRAVGDSCNATTYTNDECSYRGSGKGCDNVQNKCVDLVANGSSCEPTNFFSSSCQSGLCNASTSSCANADELMTEGACQFFQKSTPDAGDGG